MDVDESKMKRAFELFDKDGDGIISEDELANVMSVLGKPMSKAELKGMIGGAVDGQYTARGAAIDFATFQQMVRGDVKAGKGDLGSEITDLQEAFKLLDKDNRGFITAIELVQVCKRLGEDLTLEEADAMVSEALIGYQGQIYYDGLLKILITQ